MRANLQENIKNFNSEINSELKISVSRLKLKKNPKGTDWRF